MNVIVSSDGESLLPKKLPPPEELKAEIAETKQKLEVIELALPKLEKLLSDIATPDKIKEWLINICEAEDVRINKMGDQIKTPNWEARIKGVDRVMSILKYSSKDPVIKESKPTKIVIQVIESTPIDAAIPVQEIPQGQ